jgi:hypothetical protein
MINKSSNIVKTNTYRYVPFKRSILNVNESIKDRYQLNYFICIKNFNAETITSFNLNLFCFFICCYQHHERKTICLHVYFSDIRQIVRYQTQYLFSRFLGLSILQLLIMYRIYDYDILTIMSIPTTFHLVRVLTSDVLGRRLPVFTLLLWQRQYIIVVDAVHYKCPFTL